MSTKISTEFVAKHLLSKNVDRFMVANINGKIHCSNPEASFLIPYIIESREYKDHEAVLIKIDESTGCIFIVSIHSSKRGRPEGGVRLKYYSTFAEGVDDVLRLSHGMTLKNAAANIWEGGAKAVIMPYTHKIFENIDEGKASILGNMSPTRLHVMYQMAGFVSSLQGLYLAGEDVNLNSADMDAMLQKCVHVSCLNQKSGGCGNPSPYTAMGIFKAIEASCQVVFSDNSTLEGKKILLKGLGNVGYPLAESLAKAGANLVIFDPYNQKSVQKLLSAYPSQVSNTTDYQQFISTPADIFSPNATSLSIGANEAEHLQVKIICGGENAQLSSPELVDVLHQKGITYVPEIWINWMGVFSAYQEHMGIVQSEFLVMVNNIHRTTLQLLKEAILADKTPYTLAMFIIQQRVKELHLIYGHRGIKIIEELLKIWCNKNPDSSTDAMAA